MVTYGGMSRRPVTLPTTLFIFKNLTATGFWMTEWYKRLKVQGNEQARMDMLKDLFALHRNGKLRPVLHDTVSWDANNQDTDALEKELVDAFKSNRKGIFSMTHDVK